MIHIMKHSQYVVLVRNCNFFNSGYTRTKASNNNDDHLCPHHNNVMQFLEVSKNCQLTWLESSTLWKKSYLNFALNVLFFIKKLKGAILSQNHRRSQRSGPEGWPSGARDPSFEMPPMTQIWQKNLVSSFSVSFSIFAYTTVHAYNSN